MDGLGGDEPLAICLSKTFLVLMDGNGRVDQPDLFASGVCLLSFSPSVVHKRAGPYFYPRPNPEPCWAFQVQRSECADSDLRPKFLRF